MSNQQTPYQFFYEHAGFSYDPKTETVEQGKRRCSKAMEAAEQEGKARGIEFNWMNDDMACSGCDCGDSDCACGNGTPHETLVCVAYAKCQCCGLKVARASLGGICGATDEYRRVVEAELAMEALDELSKHEEVVEEV